MFSRLQNCEIFVLDANWQEKKLSDTIFSGLEAFLAIFLQMLFSHSTKLMYNFFLSWEKWKYLFSYPALLVECFASEYAFRYQPWLYIKRFFGIAGLRMSFVVILLRIDFSEVFSLQLYVFFTCFRMLFSGFHNLYITDWLRWKLWSYSTRFEFVKEEPLIRCLFWRRAFYAFSNVLFTTRQEVHFKC